MYPSCQLLKNKKNYMEEKQKTINKILFKNILFLKKFLKGNFFKIESKITKISFKIFKYKKYIKKIKEQTRMEEINEIKEDKNNKNNLNKNNEEIFENILNIVHNLEKNIQDNYLNQQTTNNDIKEEITNNKRIIDKINEEIIKMNNEEYRKIIDYHLFNINNKQKKT